MRLKCSIPDMVSLGTAQTISTDYALPAALRDQHALLVARFGAGHGPPGHACRCAGFGVSVLATPWLYARMAYGRMDGWPSSACAGLGQPGFAPGLRGGITRLDRARCCRLALRGGSLPGASGPRRQR